MHWIMTPAFPSTPDRLKAAVIKWDEGCGQRDYAEDVPHSEKWNEFERHLQEVDRKQMLENVDEMLRERGNRPSSSRLKAKVQAWLEERQEAEEIRRSVIELVPLEDDDESSDDDVIEVPLVDPLQVLPE